MVVVGSPKAVDLSKAGEIIDRYMDENPNEVPEEAIIPIFQQIQEVYGYVPQSAADLVADRLGIFLTPIYGSLSFYSDFRFAPPGQKIIFLCDGAACHIRRNQVLLDVIKGRLGIGPRETTPDGKITLETTTCLGACDLAPLIEVEHSFHGNMTAEDMEKLIDSLLSSTDTTGRSEG
ncbi:MAG: NAD(P)H-dependent oxidoreductase subunit E [Chloroflexi bacterium]|nr:NAD(P)H-dependent oxidoreductase subunit E [Chloroflexota bacterium]